MRFILKRRPWFDVLDVRYTDVVEDASGQARRIVSFLGLSLDVERMAGAVDRQLYRNRAADLATP